MSPPRILVYLLRRDLRFADNPVFYEIIKAHQQSHHSYTHLLPIYVFSAQQIEVSGFLSSSEEKSPYPEARSQVGGFWRCGQHRAKFLAECVYDLKQTLQGAGNSLEVRVGMVGDVVKSLLEAYKEDKDRGEIVEVWMTSEDGVEERREERDTEQVCSDNETKFKLWQDEKYFIDDRDVPSQRPDDLPDLFTAYRKTVEPLRDVPRKTLSVQGTLPPLPAFIPSQHDPFKIPAELGDTLSALLKPIQSKPDLPGKSMVHPSNAPSAHPFIGGEGPAHERVKHLLSTGAMTRYKDTRNGMIGEDFSTKLSAYLALGCISARQVHTYLLDFEDGRTGIGKGAHGYAKGENKGTGWVRFELLWRDYMRLCGRKHRHRLFRPEGFQAHATGRAAKSGSDPPTNYQDEWRSPSSRDPEATAAFERFLRGETGTGLIDASMRELWLTGYTSNRARQNVASYLAKHLRIDWRLGAEWYESQLADYDVCSNWGNWQYVALGDRVFNPVKQCFDYDSHGEYVKMWVYELRSASAVEGIFQAWKVQPADRESVGLSGVEWVERPLVRIEYRPGGGKGGKGGGNGGGRGDRGHRGGGRGRGKSRGQRRRGDMDRAAQAGA